MKSDAHAFGFALRAIQAGHDVEEIHRAFEAALKTMHATATDVGLSSGQPTQTFYCLSSTVSLAQRKLRDRAGAVFKPHRETRPKSSRKRDVQSYQMPPGITKIRRSTAPATSQVKRFADIMSALA
jgi:hypothetical protein